MHVRVAGAIVLAIGGLATAASRAQAADPGEQIAALQAIKKTLTSAERKLDSQIAVDLRRRAKSGLTEVDITTTEGTGEDLVPRLLDVGATIRYASPRTGDVRAGVPARMLKTVAAWSIVRRVDTAADYRTAHFRARRESKAQLAARRDAALQAISALAPVVSEGDRTHAADTVRTRDKVTGIGTKLCALSDGVNSLAASQAAGELPAVDILPGQAGSGNEGTAMLQILHDLAPRAELGFATAINSAASFADNIRALRFTAHCDVIVDDILYYNEPAFQDGPIAQAVNAVTADGALYFSSAGNEGNTLDGTSGNYEGDFRGSGRGVGKIVGEAHDFDPGPAVQVFDPLSEYSLGSVVTMFWAEALGHAASDYDVYIFDSAGNLLNFSQNVQDGNDDPYERLDMTRSGTGYRIAVVRYSGEPRYFQVSALGGRFKNSTDGLPAWATPGISRGHSAAADAFSVAAAPANTAYSSALEPGDPANPRGPFPEVFTSAQLPERFTSDGPRRIFFAADGTPAPQVRQKPEITAADGVVTSLSAPFARFFGTSAAAPHAAAIAGLVLSGNPTLTENELREAFAGTALDLAPPGVDDRTGAGVVRADRVVEYTGVTPQPLAEAQQPELTPVTGDGDAYVEPGETGRLRVPVTNVGDGTATGISVTVSTGDAQAVVTPRAQSFGDLPAGATTSRDFTLALAPAYPLGKRVRLSIRVTFAGVLSPTSAVFTVPTGQPATTVQRFAYEGPPVAIPDNSPLGASVTIAVSGVGYVSKLTFSIDGTTCNRIAGSTTVGIDHTFVGDLTGTLTTPAGTTAQLFSGSGGTGENMCQVVFDDAAATAFSTAISSRAPFTGSWRPDQPLETLLTDSADGTWTFSVIDDAPQDAGSIRAVSLSLTGFQQG